MPKRKTNAERYAAWMRSRSAGERKLQRAALEYEEEYFEDMTLQSPRMKQRLGAHELQTDAGEWVEADSDFPQPTIRGWLFCYRRFRNNLAGVCDPRIQTISILPDTEPTAEKGTLLHEMLHAYESQIPSIFREWLLIDLWETMKQKLGEKKLQKYIDQSSHELTAESQHGILFFLKCLELDVQLEWPHGTTFAYGREELLRE